MRIAGSTFRITGRAQKKRFQSPSKAQESKGSKNSQVAAPAGLHARNEYIKKTINQAWKSGIFPFSPKNRTISAPEKRNRFLCKSEMLEEIPAGICDNKTIESKAETTILPQK